MGVQGGVCAFYRLSPWMCSDCDTEALQLQQDVSCISQGLPLKKKPFLVDLAALYSTMQLFPQQSQYRESQFQTIFLVCTEECRGACECATSIYFRNM